NTFVLSYFTTPLLNVFRYQLLLELKPLNHHLLLDKHLVLNNSYKLELVNVIYLEQLDREEENFDSSILFRVNIPKCHLLKYLYTPSFEIQIVYFLMLELICFSIQLFRYYSHFDLHSLYYYFTNMPYFPNYLFKHKSIELK